MNETSDKTTHPSPHGSGGSRIAVLRAAVWRAMVEIENDGVDAAYDTLLHAYNESLQWKFGE